MKLIIAMTFVALLAIASTGLANPLNVYSIDGPQDPLFIQGPVDELGEPLGVFPPDELIVSAWTETDEVACLDGTEDPDIPNILVSITNLTTTFWRDLHYVADPETFISNFDGAIGNAGLGDATLAFRIDGLITPGINNPLVAESIAVNEIFEPGETWVFIIDDFMGIVPFAPATPFDSLGIASLSSAWPPSTGSIIAIPEPVTLAVLILGGLAALIRRRR